MKWPYIQVNLQCHNTTSYYDVQALGNGFNVACEINPLDQLSRNYHYHPPSVMGMVIS